VVDIAEGEVPQQLQDLLAAQASISSSISSSSSAAVEAAVAAVAAARSVAAAGAACGGGAGGAAGSTVAPQPPGGTHGPPRFLLDGMLGRLCRWLRCLVSRRRCTALPRAHHRTRTCPAQWPPWAPAALATPSAGPGLDEKAQPVACAPPSDPAPPLLSPFLDGAASPN
jgi:hypothetical protein